MGSGEVEKVAPRPPVPRTETKTKYSSSQSPGNHSEAAGSSG